MMVSKVIMLPFGLVVSLEGANYRVINLSDIWISLRMYGLGCLVYMDNDLMFETCLILKVASKKLCADAHATLHVKSFDSK